MTVHREPTWKASHQSSSIPGRPEGAVVATIELDRPAETTVTAEDLDFAEAVRPYADQLYPQPCG